MTEECDMVILEYGDFNYWWECANCLERHKDTAKFEKSKTYPKCGAVIKKWVGIDDGHA